MVRAYLISLFTTCAFAHLSKRFTVGDTPRGIVDDGVISDCTYWVNVESGDTCSAIESYFYLTEAEFTSYNFALGSDCSGLTVGHSYCVEENYGRGPASTTTTTTSSTSTSPTPTPTVLSPTQTGLISTCQSFYKVVSGDTCQEIVDSYGTFTLSDFYSWNPAVGNDCHGLLAGYYVCVGVPGTPSKPTTTTSTGPSPEQTGIIETCQAYYKVQAGDTCQGIVDKYRTFTLSDFYTWNPAIGSSCTDLQAGYYVCVGIPGTPTSPTTTASPSPTGPSPAQSGIISTCTEYYKAVSGDTCQVIANKFDQAFTVTAFEKWNPAVGPKCSDLWVGYYYCVAAPGSTTPSGPQPQQSGTIASCKKYHKVVSGDTCVKIEREYGITAGQFSRWNKGVGSNCRNLWLEYYVCVGV